MGEQIIHKISLREYIIDFFGALIPGMIAILLIFIGSLMPLIWCLSALEIAIVGHSEWYQLLIKFFGVLISSNFIVLLFLIIIYLIVSFVVGIIYNRRDIKLPDRNSFIRTILSFESNEDMENWIVVINDANDKIGEHRKKVDGRKKFEKWFFSSFDKYQIYNALKDIISIGDVQFPYKNLPRYLEVRGYTELARKIPWYAEETIEDDEEKAKVLQHRSKTFINILKNRIYLKNAESYNFIIKHEGEIRMSATLWHLAGTVMVASGLASIICLVCVIVISLKTGFSTTITLPLILSLITCFLAWRIRAKIEGFLHYQRVREIFYVLTTAQVLSDDTYDMFALDFDKSSSI